MKIRYLLLTLPFIVSSCNLDSPNSSKSKKIDISEGIPVSFTISHFRKQGEIISEETFGTIEFSNSLFFLFDKIENKGISTHTTKKIIEYLERNSDETNYTEKIIKDETFSKGVSNKQPFEKKEISDIEGETFIYKKEKNKWVIDLLNKNPTAKQKDILNDMNISRNSLYSCTEQNNLNDSKIKLGEKINITQKDLCLFGVDDYGNFEDVTLTFTDTISIDGILYAKFLLLGEVEMMMDKLSKKSNSSDIKSKSNGSGLSMKCNFIGKIILDVRNNFIEKIDIEMSGKGKGTTSIMDTKFPIDFEVTIKSTTKSELLSRKK
jgi:mevalonate kinase